MGQTSEANARAIISQLLAALEEIAKDEEGQFGVCSYPTRAAEIARVALAKAAV